jgi:hypothetical protein
MSRYPHSGLYSSRRKHISQATSSLYLAHQNRDEVEHGRAEPSSIYPVSSGAYNRSALADITNTNHEDRSQTDKPLPEPPTTIRGGPTKSSLNGTFTPASLSSFSSIDIDDASAQAVFNVANAAKRGSKIISASDSPTPWSYFKDDELKQIAKSRGEVLARAIQPIDEPFEGQKLQSHVLPQCRKKTVKFLIGDDDDSQARADLQKNLAEVQRLQVKDEPEQSYLSNGKKEMIERWLKYSSSNWGEIEASSVWHPENIVVAWETEEHEKLEGSEISVELNKLAITSLDNLPIRRLNFVTATDMTKKHSPADPDTKKVRFMNKATVIGHSTSWVQREFFHHFP